MSVVHVANAKAFDDLIAANRFVLVDFSATWCGPCKAIAPLLDKLAAQHSIDGFLAFAKVDVDEVSDVAARYSVSAMPTFMFFANGAPAAVDVSSTALPKTNGGAAVWGPNGIDYIRGADPRSLTAAAAKLGELAKAHAAKKETAKA